MLNLEKLNEYQRAAVVNQDPACLVNANVGSGKTTVLVAKAQYLHETMGVPYEQMVVLTFTNKAADEIRDRLKISRQIQVEDRLQEEDKAEKEDKSEDTVDKTACAADKSTAIDESRYFGTFHSVAMRLLQTQLDLAAIGYGPDFQIILSEDELELAKELIAEHKLKIKYQNRLAKRLESEKVNKYKDDLGQLRRILVEAKRQRQVMSYDDLINYTVELLDAYQKSAGTDHTESISDIKWIIIDEVQDSDARQLEMIRLLQQVSGAGIFAVGDPSQSIYSFRSGTINVFYRLKEMFHGTELSLPINYRSNATILAAAKYFQQSGQALKGIDPSQNPIIIRQYFDPLTEADDLAGQVEELQKEGVLLSEIAILYRMQSQGDILEDVFGRLGIPVDVYPRKVDKSEESEDKLEESQVMPDEPMDAVRLMTLHASKGLEYRYVFIIGVNDGLLPMGTSYDQEEEERRLFYVGMTRAREHLQLSFYMNPGMPRVREGEGRFLKNIPPELTQRDVQDKPAVSLQDLKRMVLDSKAGLDNTMKSEAAPVVETSSVPEQAVEPVADTVSGRRVSHPKYGNGRVTAEDDIMITVEFDDYGSREFMKALSGLTEIV